MRPKVLKEAAAKHNLFLAEDGSVLEIFDEDKSPKKKREKKGDVADENGDDKGKKKVCDVILLGSACLTVIKSVFIHIFVLVTEKGQEKEGTEK